MFLTLAPKVARPTGHLTADICKGFATFCHTKLIFNRSGKTTDIRNTLGEIIINSMNTQQCNLDTSEEDIIKTLQNLKSVPQNNEGRQLDSTYLTNLLSSKYQKQILEDQNKFNERLFKQNRWLVWGTWALVLVTALLVLYS